MVAFWESFGCGDGSRKGEALVQLTSGTLGGPVFELICSYSSVGRLSWISATVPNSTHPVEFTSATATIGL